VPAATSNTRRQFAANVISASLIVTWYRPVGTLPRSRNIELPGGIPAGAEPDAPPLCVSPL
jgi:hypothetical protein